MLERVLFGGKLQWFGFGFTQHWLPDPALAIDELVTVAAAVAEKIAVHLAVVTVVDAPQCAIALGRDRVATQAAMHAHRRRRLQVPLARVVPLECLIGENAGGADLHQVAAEFALERAVLVAAEIDLVAQHERVEIAAAGIVAVEAHAAVALDAAVHLVVDEGPQVLVAERALPDAVAAIVVPGHHRHVLQMAFAALVAHRAIVRMVQHQPFDHAGAKLRAPRGRRSRCGSVCGGRHARHDDLAALVVLVLELLDRALAARAHRAQRRDASRNKAG